MINTVPIVLHTYFENAVGRLLEHPIEQYILFEYRNGPRQLSELQAFLHHAAELLSQRGWDKLQGQGGIMAAFTPEEIKWITQYWFTKKHNSFDLYGAMLLPHEVFAQLSWKGTGSTMRPLTMLSPARGPN